MAAYFIDIDSTLVVGGTNDLLPGAIFLLQRLTKGGHQIILTTYRGDNFSPASIYSKRSTESLIRTILDHGDISIHTVLYNVDSPRIVINDSGAYGINHEPNNEWTPTHMNDALALSAKRISKRTRSSV